MVSLRVAVKETKTQKHELSLIYDTLKSNYEALTCEGLRVGSLDGFKDGAKLGSRVGRKEGATVGSTEGSKEGV
jgi:hypothetical protein